MNPDHWGRGIMTEAAHAAIAWRKHPGTSDSLTELEAFIEPGNTGSIALAERLGMHATPDFSDGAQRYLVSV